MNRYEGVELDIFREEKDRERRFRGAGIYDIQREVRENGDNQTG